MLFKQTVIYEREDKEICNTIEELDRELLVGKEGKLERDRNAYVGGCY